MTLAQSLATPAFWIFGIGTSLFNLISSGVLLFNESILAERGFPAETYYVAMAIGTFTGLLGNVAAGWVISRQRIAKVTAATLLVLAGSLVALAALRTYWQVVCWTVVNGAVGGVITVVFFAVWNALYGRRHLGKIQGAAQMLTVFASALGPLVFAEVKERTGSYLAILATMALPLWLPGSSRGLYPCPARRVCRPVRRRVNPKIGSGVVRDGVGHRPKFGQFSCLAERLRPRAIDRLLPQSLRRQPVEGTCGLREV